MLRVPTRDDGSGECARRHFFAERRPVDQDLHAVGTRGPGGTAQMTATQLAADGPIRVRLVESPLEMAALSASWEALQAGAVITSVFETFDWQHLWWQSYGRGHALRVMVATAGDAVVGILPVYVHTVSMLRYPVRLLRFVGTGGDTSPDDLGPILAVGGEVEAARALAEAVLRLPGWDVLLLADMNPSCPFTSAIAAVARDAQLRTLTGRSERIAYVDLAPTWDAYTQALSSHRRKRIRYIRKNFGRGQPTRFFVWDDPATLEKGFDSLVRLHHKRWNRIGQRHAFSSPEYLAFHRAVMDACLARDRLRLYCLELSGQIVAAQYCYKFRNAVYVMQTGFDPDFSDAGQVLLSHMVEHAIGEGHKVLDFLRGDHAYKEHFAASERETMFVTAFRQTPGAWVYRTRRMYLPAIKARLLKALRHVRPAEPTST